MQFLSKNKAAEFVVGVFSANVAQYKQISLKVPKTTVFGTFFQFYCILGDLFVCYLTEVEMYMLLRTYQHENIKKGAGGSSTYTFLLFVHMTNKRTHPQYSISVSKHL